MRVSVCECVLECGCVHVKDSLSGRKCERKCVGGGEGRA